MKGLTTTALGHLSNFSNYPIKSSLRKLQMVVRKCVFFSRTILNAKGLYYSRYVESVKFEILLFSFRYNVPGVLVKSVKEKEY